MNATLLEVPPERWQSYFTFLDKEFQGWGASVETLAGELGDQPVAHMVPFQGISFEYKGGSAAGDVLVEVGDIGTPYEVHRINRPRVVRATDMQPGIETDVQIESQDGTTTLIRLRRLPALPPKQPG
ncbi:MAG TPA: DUF5335 family protein [Tepidisphaeraceae bacterium]|jgi:hypothetical protein